MTNHDAIIREYIRISRALSRLICQKFNTIFPLQPWLQMKVDRIGFINKNVEYNYHGKGCAFEFRKKNDECKFETLNLDYVDNFIILNNWKISQFFLDNYGITIETAEIESIMSAEESVVRDIFWHKGYRVVSFRRL